MPPQCAKGNPSLLKPIPLRQMGEEQIQTPLQIPHLMSNLRGVWICSTLICHNILEVIGDESNLVHFGVTCIQKVGTFGVICSNGSKTICTKRLSIRGLPNSADYTVKPPYNDHLSYCDKWSIKTHDFLILLIFSTGST